MQMEMPKSIVTLKNVEPADRQVWLDISPEEIGRRLDTDDRWLVCRRFVGGTFYSFFVDVKSVVLVEPYR